MAELGARLQARIERAQKHLRAVALWRAAWRPLLGLGVLVALAGTGVIALMPVDVAAMLGLGGWGLLGWLCVGLWRARGLPSMEAAARWLDAGLEGAPWQSLSDRLAPSGAEAAAHWQAARSALTARLAAGPEFDARAAWRTADPWRLRWALGFSVAAALYSSGLVPALGRVTDAFRPDIGALLPGPPITVEAWVSPPDYTGRPPRYLRSDDIAPLSVPAGSVLTLRATAASAPRLHVPGLARPVRMTKGEDGVFSYTGPLTDAGEVRLVWWRERARWSLGLEADLAPVVGWSQAPSRAGEDSIDFGYAAQDDFGVESVALVLRRADGISGQPATERVALPSGAVTPAASGGSQMSATETLLLVRHRWAGLAVELRLEARDGAGQVTESEPQTMVLPQRTFLQPFAQAAQEIRAVVLRCPADYLAPHPAHDPSAAMHYTPLERAPADILQATRMLEALTFAPEPDADLAVLAGLSYARAVLSRAETREQAERVEATLWETAIRAEFGTSADRERAFAEARRALERAIDRGASADEIKALVERFRSAALDLLAERMAGARASEGDAGEGAGAPGGPELAGQDIDDMLKALEELAANGDAAAAQRFLDDVAGLLDSLQFERSGTAENGQDGEPSQFERDLMERLGELADLLAQQRGLNEETFRQRQQQRSGPDGGGADAESLAAQQRTLSEALRAERDRWGADEQGGRDTEGGTGGAQALAEALEALEEAARALDRGDMDRALAAQDKALRALREAQAGLGAELDAAMARRLGEDPSATDPLGREPEGLVGTGDGTEVPTEGAARLQRSIRDELQRRLADPNRTREERDYLERLLERF